jgi:hypothetical protein
MGWFGKRSETEQRKRKARLLYEFETECRTQGWGDPAFVHDLERDLLRWTDDRSRMQAYIASVSDKRGLRSSTPCLRVIFVTVVVTIGRRRCSRVG